MKTPNQMTGLEIMQAFQQGLVPPPGIAKTMGMEGVAEVEYGRIVFIAIADERHTNPLGGVHGGFAATDLAIKMCRPMPFNKKLIAEGKVINVGRNLVISEGYLRDEEGKLYAHATATNMVIRT